VVHQPHTLSWRQSAVFLIPGHLTHHLIPNSTRYLVIPRQVSYEVFCDLEQLSISELDVTVTARPGVYVFDRITDQHL
jgi:hypothetical protein